MTFTSFKDEEPSNITGSVPNPFHFNQPRSFAGTSDPLTHQEQTVHVSALWRVRVSPTIEVGVGGGPSFISVQQDFVKDVEFNEQYPFDTATFSRAVTEQVKQSFVGFHVGGDLAWYFTRNIGVSGTVRYSHANADVTTPANNQISMKVGGVETTVGVRLSFGGRPVVARPSHARRRAEDDGHRAFGRQGCGRAEARRHGRRDAGLREARRSEPARDAACGNAAHHPQQSARAGRWSSSTIPGWPVESSTSSNVS